MPRFRNRDTGVVVNVSDEQAERLPVTFEKTTKAASSESKPAAKKSSK